MLAKDMLRGMVIKDQFGDGLTLEKGSLRAVRYAPGHKVGLRTKLTSKFPVLDNTKKLFSIRMQMARSLVFTIEFGDNYNWPNVY